VSAVEVEGLTKRMRDRAVLEDISLRAEAGDIVSVLGPSGSGKTTLFRCILGEITPDAGTIRLDGQDVHRVPTEKRGVGIVYQGYALFPHLDVEDNIAYGLRARGVPRERRLDRVREMLALVHLEGKEDQLPVHLSGGEKQRVALARALAVEPRVLLLDEAFGALDASTRSQVVQEVRGIIKGLKVTTLLVTHDQEEAFLFARKVLVLNEGRVVTFGRSLDVMTHPDPFIQSFVKMVMFERAKVERDRVGLFVATEGGARIPIDIPNVDVGEEVHVMIKRGPSGPQVGVWRPET
jgi:putative spermidine/putrescine transport system ATP-binding protein